MTDDCKKAWAKLAGVHLDGSSPVQYTRNDPGFKHYGHWYLVAGKGYLHNDGNIYENAQDSGTAGSSGWFKTKQDAEKAIELYYELLYSGLINRSEQ